MTVVRDIRIADEEDWRRLFRDYGKFYETTLDRAVLDGVWLTYEKEIR